MPHAQDENLIISLLLCFYVSRANASADFYRIVPSKFAVGAFSFRVQAKRNSEGAVHFVVNITSAKGADFPKDVEFSLDKVVEKDPFPMLSTMKKLGAVMDGNSAVCTFDAPNDFRTFSGAGSPRGPSPRPSLLFTSAEQVASLRSSAGCPNQRFGTGSSLLRTPPTPVMARTASLFEEVVPPVESSFTMTGPSAYPSVTSSRSRGIAHADPAGPLSESSTVGPDSDSTAFTQT
jgi:hypothetical protein